MWPGLCADKHRWDQLSWLFLHLLTRVAKSGCVPSRVYFGAIHATSSRTRLPGTCRAYGSCGCIAPIRCRLQLGFRSALKAVQTMATASDITPRWLDEDHAE